MNQVTEARMLDTAEAAARLGVKRATLYAYVSRGLINREAGPDGRSSLFDAAEIESFRSGRRQAAEGELNTALTTAITRVSDEGVWIRGHDLVALVGRDPSYEEVVDLLWEAEPGEGWSVPRAAKLKAALVHASMPTEASYMDRVRVTTVLASALDPLRHDLSGRAVRSAGRQLIGLMVDALARGKEAPGDRIADRLWVALTHRPGRTAERQALNAAMSILVDHGLAASNFSARIAGSVRADPYSAVLAGLGALGGTLHGAASAGVHELLLDAEKRDVPRALVDAHRRLGRTPGFGHRVYKNQDPRCEALLERVAAAWEGDPRLNVITRVHQVVADRTDDVANVDLALGALTYMARMEAEAGEVIFAISRTAGWLAHAAEEYTEEPLRFRPKARYVGRPPIESEA
ncbi:MAG: citrate/2-methylcitrate synthase [Longimicrobiales bacterium]